MTGAIKVVSFYRFVRVVEPRALGEEVRAKAAELDLLGTAIVAPEGLNATLSGGEANCQRLLQWLGTIPGFADISGRWSDAEAAPFRRLRIKYRDEIVSMGHADVNPADGQGQHVDAAQWNALLEDPDTRVIDTRNIYEVEVGSFAGAVDPGTTNFREFTRYIESELAADRDKPIAMFCTGGIRCEKATAVMQRMGFENLYQLDGGILSYLDQVAADDELDNHWQGECFVFDSRVAVDQALTPGGYVQCHGCRRALDAKDLAHPDYEPGICCARCADRLSDTQRRQFEERRKQVALAAQRGETHIGAEYPTKRSNPE
ncbi:MAG: rhodanese-related sulfurtransferase [Pseudomonadota bacterium]